MDHGSANTEMALAQLRLMAKNGTTDVVATPHFYPQKEKVERFLEKRERALAKLSPLLEEGMPRVFIGAEVLLCAGMENMKDLHKLCIEGTNLLLLERPFLPLTNELADTVYRIDKLGYTVLLAHIDRYDPRETCSLLFPNVKAQVNTKTLTGFFSRKKIMPFFRDHMVSALGSDLHGTPADYNGFPKAKKILKSHYDAVMQESCALLNGAIPLK